MVILYLSLPWININGHPVILLDIPNRTFFLFGGVFRGHDIPLVFLVLALFGFFIAAVTTLGGRLWCGWACPQTVFVEGIFLQIERWVEGKGHQRRKMDQGPMTFQKFFLKWIKWSLFIFVAFAISHSFMAYFVGVAKLPAFIAQGPERHMGYFMVTLGMTAIVLFDFGWFREQFCLIACPYGRFQSVFMDEHSLVVGYDTQRGEPRVRPSEKVEGQPSGDCIDCFRCVQVCPTGIDIRRGTQLECIACTRCIDACDQVMRTLNKPEGLVRYTSEAALSGKEYQLNRPRLFAYTGIISLLAIVLTFLLWNRSPININILKAQGLPYRIETVQGQEYVVNHLKLKIHNQSEVLQKFDWKLDPQFQNIVIESPNDFVVGANKVKLVHLFVKVPKKRFQGESLLRLPLKFNFNKTSAIVEKELFLVGPR